MDRKHLNRRNPRHKPALFSTLEQLEARQLMTAVLNSGTTIPTLYVDGTEGNDVINVAYSNSPFTGRRLTIKRNADPSTIVTLTNQNVVIRGLGGNDLIKFSGALGVDIQGGAGNDSIIGGSGNDFLSGNDGDDLIDGGAGSDVIMGGAGIDLADYSSRTTNVNINLDQIANDGEAGENDNIMNDTEGAKGGSGNDIFTGNSFNNVFYGGAGNDLFHGGSGSDFARGGDGSDMLFGDTASHVDFNGDAGNDSLYGSSGPDVLCGGDGDDVIISIGGSQSDCLWGQGGNDSFWADAESTEIIADASAFESIRNVHRVANFEAIKLGSTNLGSPSRELLGQNFADPALTHDAAKYTHFSNVPLFNNGTPSEDDVNQGHLGDCYFMAPLASLAKTAPNVIEQSVVELGDGTYAVELRRDGVGHFIRVDADLPTDANGNLVYDIWRRGVKQMWAPIMEKAWAAFRGDTADYAAIEGGFPVDTYKTLGVSSNSLSPLFIYQFDTQAFASALGNFLAAGKSVSVCTDSGGGILEESHCYTLDHVTIVNGNVVSITLRNPWGTDGKHTDGVEDGYVTLSPAEALGSISLVTIASAA